MLTKHATALIALGTDVGAFWLLWVIKASGLSVSPPLSWAFHGSFGEFPYFWGFFPGSPFGKVKYISILVLQLTLPSALRNQIIPLVSLVLSSGSLLGWTLRTMKTFSHKRPAWSEGITCTSVCAEFLRTSFWAPPLNNFHLIIFYQVFFEKILLIF